MNLVDSSGWLEYFTDGKNAKYFSPVIENTEELIVSPINIYEIFKKVLAEKNESTAIQVVGLMQQAKVIGINSTIAIQSAKFSYQFKMPMADSIIYTTARLSDALVWTQDVHLKGLEGVKYFKKLS